MTRRPDHAARRGFSLLELAIALAIIGLLTGGTMQLVTAFSAEQRLDVTRQRLKAVEEALVRYASRHGRLPCPRDASAMTVALAGSELVVAGFGKEPHPNNLQLADASETACDKSDGTASGCEDDDNGDENEDGGDGDGDGDEGDSGKEGSGDNGNGDSENGGGDTVGALPEPTPAGSNPSDIDPNWKGTATGGNCSRSPSQVGVPWQQLGIPKSAALDGWNRQITYVVFNGSNSVSQKDGINLFDSGDDTLADYLGNLQARPTDRGLIVRDGDGECSDADTNCSHNPDDGTGAAFVLISHGPNGVGAFTRNGSQIDADGVAFGDHEENNRQSARDIANGNDPADHPFIDRTRNESESDEHYDDIMRAMSVHEVARRAGWTPLAGR